MLVVHSLYGEIEPLVDYELPTRKWVLNGEYSLNFWIYRSSSNSCSFDLIQGRSLIQYEDDYFRVTQCGEWLEYDTPFKEVTCVNAVITDLETNRVYSELSGSISITQAMNLITNGTKITYSLDGNFRNVTFEKYGENNSYELFKEVLEKFKVEYSVSAFHITIKNRIGKDNDFQFRHKHNITGTDRQSDINTLRTYIKGFGKQREETDISTGIKSTLVVDDFDGKWDNSTSEELAEWNAKNTGVGMGKKTDVLGDSFQFKFTGTGFSIDMICTWLGGKVVFTIDGSNTKTVSLWSPITDQVKTFEIIRGLENKTHSVDVRLASRDGKNTMTKGDVLPVFHQPTGKIITTYRARVGSEKYYASVGYLSPNSTIPQYGILHADPIYNEDFTDNTSLLNFIKGELQDTPTISTQFDYHTLVNDIGQDIGRGDSGWLMHEKLGIDIYTRVVEITDYPTSNKTPIITIGNVLLNGTKQILKGKGK
ncbi:prophage endopeptidase tail family protein [Peribacillus sp. SIMBA_075]|uniref:prophage endopeptidase tail family protein n=1 Tax=Peribacillus sp. SIMBA_075 TaxID=3085813 RepID=UPI00397E7FAE